MVNFDNTLRDYKSELLKGGLDQDMRALGINDKMISELKAHALSGKSDESLKKIYNVIASNHNNSRKLNLTQPTEYIKDTQKLDLNYSLPIIGIPEDKTISFLQWYIEDLSNCAIKDIPHPFEEGYISIQKIPYKFKDNIKGEFIKEVAHKIHRTYNQVLAEMEKVYQGTSESIIIHYKFVDGLPDLSIYNGDDYLCITRIPFTKLGADATTPLIHNPINIDDDKYVVQHASCLLDGNHGERFQDDMTILYYALFMGAVWYMALYKNRTKYERIVDKDGVREVMYKSNMQIKPKHNHNNSNVRTITTSFYDLSKAPKSKVSTLKKKREGWTMTHQFDVTGHYRHYKSGKVVYIDSYTKCKDKPRLEGSKYYVLEPRG